MGFRQSDGSIGPVNAMIARLRKATSSWTIGSHQSYSGGVGDQAVEQPALGVPDIPDLELLRCIGRGAYGEVWLARNILGTYRAVKVIHRNAFRDDEAFEREFSGLRRFEPVSREHDGFVAILHVGRDRADTFFYYVMELADDDANADRIYPDTYLPKTLSHELARCGRLSVKESVQLGLSLSDALGELHQRGLVHRDVKPSNIICVKGHAKLADIGLVAETGEKKRLGTEGYIPPEGPGKPQGDIYSLGMMLYEASTGTDRLEYPELPADFDVMADREAFLKLNSIILKACEQDVRKRYQTATEISEDLMRLGVDRPVQNVRSSFLRNPITAFAGILLGILAFAFGVYWFRHSTASSTPEKSIAVLPFENPSGDPNDANFADGIQEEILTRLAKIRDLKVISRTSTQRYQSKPRNLPEIAKQLGVAIILEGSVQKANDQVRVNVQLINAQTDSDLWADTYDRKLTDIPGVENEIAKRIAVSLQAKLSDREEEALAVKPTKHPEAQDAYIRGLAIEARNYAPSFSRAQALKVCISYEHAVQLDPYFAAGWARLSRSEGHLYFSPFDHSAIRRNEAKRALENAQKLEPNSPETLLALGYYQYRVLLDWALAKMTFGRVHKMLPGSSEVQIALSRVARHEGHWDESIAYFEQALTGDPRNLELLVTAAETYTMLRQFPTALKLYDRALDIAPNDPDITAAKAGIYQAQGNLEQAARVLSEINWQTRSEGSFTIKIAQLRLERNYAEAIRLLQDRLAQFDFESLYDRAGEQLHLAFMQRVAGDTSGAKVTGEEARNTLEDRYRHQPQEELAARMSQAYAATGEKDSALNVAQRAIFFVHAAKDRMQEPRFEENLAFIQTIVGDNASAISILTQLLQTPYKGWLYAPPPVTQALLRLDPIWDPLRGDPAFQKLCEEKQP